MANRLSQALGFGPTQPAAAPPALVGAAHVLRLGRDKITPQPEPWQAEAWEFYLTRVGELRFGVDFLANSMSRVRLVPAVMDATMDEPEPVDSGPAVDLLAEFAGGVDGQAQLLATLAVHLTVPGESWLTGEAAPGGIDWVLRSSDEIREGKRKTKGGELIPEVIDDLSATSSRAKWRPLDPLDSGEFYVAKLWRPDRRFRHLPDSPTRAALPTLRRLELVNRHIDATLLSRLASAGVVVFPNEMTFPVREEFADEADPFVAEWIETAREAIATPGTAAAVIPIPLKGPGEWIDKIKHLPFASPLDERILELRLSEIRGLATTLTTPAELLTGMGDINHWGQWFEDESSLKTSVSPLAELIVYLLTKGWQRPMLEADGVSPAEVARSVLWYDLSELAQRPDRSEAAREAYDRIEISPEAYRRESGFDESDAPSDEERDQMVLLALLKTAEARAAAEELGVLEPAPVPEPLQQQPGGPRPVADEDRPANGPPEPSSEVPVAASANGRKP
jgi:hypothetical protein